MACDECNSVFMGNFMSLCSFANTIYDNDMAKIDKFQLGGRTPAQRQVLAGAGGNSVFESQEQSRRS